MSLNIEAARILSADLEDSEDKTDPAKCPPCSFYIQEGPANDRPCYAWFLKEAIRQVKSGELKVNPGDTIGLGGRILTLKGYLSMVHENAIARRGYIPTTCPQGYSSTDVVSISEGIINLDLPRG